MNFVLYWPVVEQCEAEKVAAGAMNDPNSNCFSGSSCVRALCSVLLISVASVSAHSDPVRKGAVSQTSSVVLNVTIVFVTPLQS